tara:strand:- start:1122 stop:2021 length:900 start_codon:yes stop_codon:yes gene_type:complete
MGGGDDDTYSVIDGSSESGDDEDGATDLDERNAAVAPVVIAFVGDSNANGTMKAFRHLYPHVEIQDYTYPGRRTEELVKLYNAQLRKAPIGERVTHVFVFTGMNDEFDDAMLASTLARLCSYTLTEAERKPKRPQKQVPDAFPNAKSVYLALPFGYETGGKVAQLNVPHRQRAAEMLMQHRGVALAPNVTILSAHLQPGDVKQMRPEFIVGDAIHLNATGYEAVAKDLHDHVRRPNWLPQAYGLVAAAAAPTPRASSARRRVTPREGQAGSHHGLDFKALRWHPRRRRVARDFIQHARR